MTHRPCYPASSPSNYKTFADRARYEAALRKLDSTLADIAVIHPADPFLDTAGEDLRRRIFMTTNEYGDALCLRPEFTIPVCLSHLENEAAATTRYGYVGTVFRQRRSGAAEFLQAGLESIGETDSAAADARAIHDALRFLAEIECSVETAVVLGDQSIFDAVLDALELPRAWRLRLAHVFGNTSSLDKTLEGLSKPAPMPNLPAEITTALADGESALTEQIERRLTASGLANVGGRSAQNIAHRLMAKHRDAHTMPDPVVLSVLREFLEIRVPLAQAASAIDAFCRRQKIVISDAQDAFAKRVEAIQAVGTDPATMTYEASFGRPLDYYTGLVFELRTASGDVLVGGGRYDHLLTMLGSDTPVPGIGFAVWLDRVAAATGKVTP